MYLRYVPSAPLDAFVDCLWASERGPLPHARESNLPTGCADIVIALGDQSLSRFASPDDAVGRHFGRAIVQGPQDRPFFRDTSQGSSVVGVHFRAGGAAAILGLPLTGLSNQTFALDDLWGGYVEELRHRLGLLPDAPSRLRSLETMLKERLSHVRFDDDDGAIHWAVEQLRSLRPNPDGGIGAIRRALGWSSQRFVAQFVQRVGLTPKRFSRVQRFQGVLDRVGSDPPSSWAQLALDAGYADQAHLIREFHAFTGITPGRYRAVAPDQVNHVAVDCTAR